MAQKQKKSKAKGRGGVKLDAGKPRFDLIPFRALTEMAKVLEFGARKYTDDGWHKVPELKKRYFAAALRHLVANKLAPGSLDSESQLSHLAHALCCIAFTLEKELMDDQNQGTPLGVRNTTGRKRASK